MSTQTQQTPEIPKVTPAKEPTKIEIVQTEPTRQRPQKRQFATPTN